MSKKKTLTTEQRRQVRDSRWAWQRKRCCYCRKEITREEATLEHIRPVSRGGTDDAKNLVVACYECNQKKGDKPTPVDVMALLKAIHRIRSARGKALKAAKKQTT